MIKYFSNRELSEKLGINLAKWKRWSRELLPPDPLGGLQSGYARQYSPAEAFTLYLGGHLIADLKYTMPEVKQILTGLHDWLVRHGFFFDTAQSPSNPAIHREISAYQIFIKQNNERENGSSGFQYLIRGIIKVDRDEYKGFPVNHEIQLNSTIPEIQEPPPTHLWPCVKLLNISAVYNEFVKLLNI